MANHPRVTRLDNFAGIRNVQGPVDNERFLKDAINVDIDKDGKISRRKGYVQLDTGNYHSIWSDTKVCYAVKDGQLGEIRSDNSFRDLGLAVGDQKIRFERVENDTFFVGPSIAGVISNGVLRPWGIPNPNPRVSLAAGAGSLQKGSYQVVVTHVATDGRESGASVASSIEVSDNSSIVITDIPLSTDTTVNRVRIYASPVNGDNLYRVAELPIGTTTFTIISDFLETVPLQSFNVHPAPSGQIVRYYNGRMFVAQDNILWFSEPYHYDWFKYHKNFHHFESRITAVMPTPDGIWVGADKLYYLAGRDAVGMDLSEKEPVEVVEGSDVKIVGAYISIDNTPAGFKWLCTTDRGFYVCYNDGLVINLTEKNVSFPLADSAAAEFIQTDGINRYVSLLKEARPSANTSVGDLAVGTIIRNGVTLNI